MKKRHLERVNNILGVTWLGSKMPVFVASKVQALPPSVSLPLNGIDSDRDSGQMTTRDLGGDLASVDSAAVPWSTFHLCYLDV